MQDLISSRSMLGLNRMYRQASLVVAALALPAVAQARGGSCGEGLLCTATAAIVLLFLALVWVVGFSSDIAKKGFFRASVGNAFLQVVAGYIIIIIVPAIIIGLLFRISSNLGWVALAAFGILAWRLNRHGTRTKPQQGVPPDVPVAASRRQGRG